MKLAIHMAALLTFTLSLASISEALDRQVKLNGSSTSIRYSDLRPGQELSFFGLSNGNSSNVFRVSIYGGAGIGTSASAAKVVGSAKSTLSNLRAFYSLGLTDQKAQAKLQTQCVDYSIGDAISEEEPAFDPGSIVSISNPLCDSFSSADIAALGEGLANTYGGSWDAGRVCGYIVYVYRGGAEDAEFPPSVMPQRFAASVGEDLQIVSQEYTTILSKDACGLKRDQYIFRVKLKLPKKIPTAGYLRLRISEMKHYGGMEATIKPVSDGRFAPQPLLLMNYVGFCGQRINVVRWRKGRPISVASAKVYDLIAYSGMTLNRTPISPYLSGGQATVELWDRNSGYGACFDMSRTRQRVNGYPG